MKVKVMVMVKVKVEEIDGRDKYTSRNKKVE